MNDKWAIQDEETGKYVAYLGENVRWSATTMYAETWDTYHDAVRAFATFYVELDQTCRIVEVT